MKKVNYLLLAITIFVVLFASACGSTAAPAPQAVQPPAQVAPAVVAPVEAAATVQTFAPACQAAATCAAPVVPDTIALDTFCVEKIPYENISLDPGTTFEVLDPKGELKCRDSGTIVDGKKVITCTSKQLWTYDLKLTNTACSAGALTAGASQCQAGLGYDAAQNCCAPLTGAGDGSVIIKVNMGACPDPH
jgi:hypothetical protein